VRLLPVFLEAALADVARTRQRRPWFIAQPSGRRFVSQRPAFAAALIVGLLAIAAVGAAIGSGLFRSATVSPLPSAPPATDAARTNPPTTVDLTIVGIRDNDFTVGIPGSWILETSGCCGYARYRGSSPHGIVAIDHGDAIATTMCLPGCAMVSVPLHVPFDANRTLDALAAKISRSVGASDWRSLPSDAVPGLVGTRRLDIAATLDGEPATQTLVIGMHGYRIVSASATVAASAPADLFEQMLATLSFNGDGRNYSSGNLAPYTDPLLGYSLDVPDVWIYPEQPDDHGRPASGVRVFGERLTVSIGAPDGSITLCDPDCRTLTDQRTAVELAANLEPDNDRATRRDVGTLDGAPAVTVQSSADSSTGRIHVAAVVGGLPVVLTFDRSDGNVVVDPAAAAAMIESFDLQPVTTGGGDIWTLPLPGGHAAIDLNGTWSSATGPDPLAAYAVRAAGHRLRLTTSDANGTVRICDEPAGPWEECGPIRATTLEELRAAVQQRPGSEPGMGPPIVIADRIDLDGEPAWLVHVEAYEPPARGAQRLFYIVAVHDGRGFVIRGWTPGSGLAPAPIIAGFRFTP
jgi:hypothetical protein